MDALHPLSVTEEFRKQCESVDPHFVKEGLLYARSQSWNVFNEIKSSLKVGISEIEARELAKKIFSDHGVKKHWHQPVIRFGSGTIETFHTPLRANVFLEPNDPVYLDLGPVWYHPDTQMEYEGDVGDSYVLGRNENAEQMIRSLHELFQFGKEAWQKEKLSGEEIFKRMKLKAEDLGYELLPEVVGHRLGGFPHQKYSKERLPNLTFSPSPHLWVLELQIVQREWGMGAFFEDLMF